MAGPGSKLYAMGLSGVDQNAARRL